MTIMNMVGGGGEIENNFPSEYKFNVSAIYSGSGVSPATLNASALVGSRRCYIDVNEYLIVSSNRNTINRYRNNELIQVYTPPYAVDSRNEFLCGYKHGDSVVIGFKPASKGYTICLFNPELVRSIECKPDSTTYIHGAYSGETWYIGRPETGGIWLYQADIDLDTGDVQYTDLGKFGTGGNNPQYSTQIIGAFPGCVVLGGTSTYSATTSLGVMDIATKTRLTGTSYTSPSAVHWKDVNGFGKEHVGSVVANDIPYYSSSTGGGEFVNYIHDPALFNSGFQTIYGVDKRDGSNRQIYLYSDRGRSIKTVASTNFISDVSISIGYPGDGVLVNNVYSPNTSA